MKKQGTDRMYELGKRPAMVWLTEEDYELVKRAAAADERPMASFIRRAVLKAAAAFLNGKEVRSG